MISLSSMELKQFSNRSNSAKTNFEILATFNEYIRYNYHCIIFIYI